jgi:hypothetical protein
MGVFIKLDIIPDKIDPNEWESVYEESLLLLNSYCFMDRIVDNEKYGCNWVYTIGSAERILKECKNKLGWYTFGDTVTMKNAESFHLVKDLDFYLTDTEKANCSDVLFALINWRRDLGEDVKKFVVNSAEIFDSKTQGYPYHTYILAIACLIESRFPKYAVVSGDISKGQMQKAIEWANGILKKPIYLTQRSDNEKLLHRIKETLSNEFSALKAFMELAINPKGIELGDFIRQNFTAETILKYNTMQLSQYKIEMIGFHDQLTEYFELGYDLGTACDICVLNENGCRFNPVDFMKEVLEFVNVNDEENKEDIIRLAINDPASGEPETIPSLFGKMFLRMAGYKGRVTHFLAFDDLMKICKEKFGDLCDVEKVLNDGLDMKRTSEEKEPWDELLSKMGNSSERREQTNITEEYDIDDWEDLILWDTRKTIHPQLIVGLKKIKDFVENTILKDEAHINKVNSYTDLEKMRLLISVNRYFYLSKKTWDYIENNIKSESILNRILAILEIKADGKINNTLCEAILNNLELFKFLWEALE